MSRPALVDTEVLSQWLIGRPAWRVQNAHLVRDVRTLDYPSAVNILQRQVELAERLDHHPIVQLGYCSVRFELWTHDQRGITRLDLDYAQGLDEIIERDFSSLLA